MIYNNIVKGIFKERPNRFVAYVEINNNIEVSHVKNTGRCKELLIEGTELYLQKSDSVNSISNLIITLILNSLKH